MELPYLVLLFGVCYFHWTTASPFTPKGEMPLIRRKLCQTNGTVESLSKLRVNEEPDDNCIELSEESQLTDLSERSLNKFKRNWYQLSDATVINLSHNLITDIAPELLNDIQMPLEINLGNNKITMIRNNIIQNNNCMFLVLRGNPIEIIEDNAFKNLCLTHLDLSQSALKNLDFIKTLPVTIMSLTATGSKMVTEIPTGSFKNLQQIQWINLSSNGIKKIRNNTFSEIGAPNKLVFIHLDNNKIELIERGAFSHAYFGHINLKSNNITDNSICVGAFQHVYLKVIRLAGNPIRGITAGAFDPIGDFDIE